MALCHAVIVDYGLGNLFSIDRALKRIGATVEITDKPEKIVLANRLILPGVGAFGDGMKGLRDRGLIEPILEYVESGRSLLGICLGMQLMMSEGEEFGAHKGLNIIDGRVVSLRGLGVSGAECKIPHIGWNSLLPSRSGSPRIWKGTMLEGLDASGFVYFNHSNVVIPADPSHCLAETEYNCVFCSVIRKDNVYGCQFHPERSGEVGLEMYKRFMS